MKYLLAEFKRWRAKKGGKRDAELFNKIEKVLFMAVEWQPLVNYCDIVYPYHDDEYKDKEFYDFCRCVLKEKCVVWTKKLGHYSNPYFPPEGDFEIYGKGVEFDYEDVVEREMMAIPIILLMMVNKIV